MKQPKRLNYEQKKLLSMKGYNWQEYMFVEEHYTYIVVYHKMTGALKPIYKMRGNRNEENNLFSD